jgi:hypothetical protein
VRGIEIKKKKLPIDDDDARFSSKEYRHRQNHQNSSLYTHNDEPFWLDPRFFFYNAFLL